MWDVGNFYHEHGAMSTTVGNNLCLLMMTMNNSLLIYYDGDRLHDSTFFSSSLIVLWSLLLLICYSLCLLLCKYTGIFQSVYCLVLFFVIHVPLHINYEDSMVFNI